MWQHCLRSPNDVRGASRNLRLRAGASEKHPLQRIYVMLFGLG